jgi:hypothetical protein
VTSTARFRLEHAGEHLALSARRDGLRTSATLYRDGEPVRTASGFGKVVLPVPEEAGAVPTVLVLSVLPGRVDRALLLVPGAGPPADDDEREPASAGRTGRDAALADLAEALPPALAWVATAEKHPFAPPPGSLAARLLAVERAHPRLWASRHVALAVLKAGVAMLGLAAAVQLLLAPALSWLLGLLPDVDLPDIPWPDIDLPHLVVPDWLGAVLATAKFWVPVLVGIVVAVAEVRRRRTARAGEGQDERGADG